MSGVLGAYADRRTWEVAAYLLLGLPLGVLGFVLLVTGFSLGLGLLVTLLGIPVLVVTILLARTLASFERRLASTLLEAPLPLGGRIPDEPDRGLWRRLRAMFSIVFLAVGPWLIRRWGRVPAWVATTMLGRLEQRELKRAVVHTLERTGEADGFLILDELELQFGRGPFLTATRVQAALLALESTEQVVGRRDASRTLYALA